MNHDHQKPISLQPSSTILLSMAPPYPFKPSSCPFECSSNNSTRPEFVLITFGEAIHVHRFAGRFEATASSKISVPLRAKLISTANLGLLQRAFQGSQQSLNHSGKSSGTKPRAEGKIVKKSLRIFPTYLLMAQKSRYS